MAKATKPRVTSIESIRGFYTVLFATYGRAIADEEEAAMLRAFEDELPRCPNVLEAAWRVRLDRAIPFQGRSLLAWYAALLRLHEAGRIDLSHGLTERERPAAAPPAPARPAPAAPPAAPPAVEPDEVLDEVLEADELEPEEAPKNPTLAEMRRGLERLQAADLAWFSTARALIKNFWHWGRGVVLIGVRSILEHGKARGDEWLAALYLLHEAGVMDFAGGLDGAAVLARYNSPDKLLAEIDTIRAAFEDEDESEDAEEVGTPAEWEEVRIELHAQIKAASPAPEGALSVDVIEPGAAAEEPVERPDLADEGKEKWRLPAWVQKIGTSGALLLQPIPEKLLTSAELREFLWSRRWTEPEAPEAERAGIVDLDEPHRYRISSWSGGCFYTFGVRIERRKVSKDALRIAIGMRIAEIERDEGEEVDRARRMEIEAAMEAELLRRCVPSVEIVPVVWRPTLEKEQIVKGFCYVAGSPAQVETVGALLGWPAASIIGSQSAERVERLSLIGGSDLRVVDGAAVYPPPPGGTAKKKSGGRVTEAAQADLLLWIWSRKSRNARVDPEAPVVVSTLVAGKQKRITVPAGSGLVEATLALPGGRLQRLSVTRWAESAGEDERAELEIVLDLGENGLRLAKVEQAPNKDARWPELEGEIFARVETWRRAWIWISTLISEWTWDRSAPERWLPVLAKVRAGVGEELLSRWAFDPKTGQGLLFTPEVLKETTLPALPVPKKGGRGRAS